MIAIIDLLMRCNWAKRVLFLADRIALVDQAVKAFKNYLPDASPVNLVSEKDAEGRVFVSTYPTMMGLIDETRDGQRRFGPGHFDIVVIDEAHQEAVREKFLVPAKSVSVPLKFQREGIKYDELTEEEQEQGDAIDWDEQGEVPERIDPPAVNKWLFNKDTVDKVLEHLMTRGLMVAGEDRLGKTIIFAKNQAHADFIAERFNVNYPHFRGEFARVITFETTYAQSLIDSFSQKDKAPYIAISVDMLDTGIDIPEVVNLVFFKIIRSKTKFWQMVGRGTRLCPDLFGPGKHKQFFYVFDYCQNLEYFSANPEATEGAAGDSLGKRLFKARLELVGVLDLRTTIKGAERTIPVPELDLRHEIAELLRTEVAAMNLDNFVVCPKRRLVETYAKPEPRQKLSDEARYELGREVAGLPSELDAEPEEAKRFDLLMLRLQLAVLLLEPSFPVTRCSA